MLVKVIALSWKHYVQRYWPVHSYVYFTWSEIG